MVLIAATSTLALKAIIGCGILVSLTMDTGKYVSQFLFWLFLLLYHTLPVGAETLAGIGTKISSLKCKMVVG